MEPTNEQREQLRQIGRYGKPAGHLDALGIKASEFLGYGWIRPHRIEMMETTPPGTGPTPDPISFHLTDEGAKHAGIDLRDLPPLY